MNFSLKDASQEDIFINGNPEEFQRAQTPWQQVYTLEMAITKQQRTKETPIKFSQKPCQVILEIILFFFI